MTTFLALMAPFRDLLLQFPESWYGSIPVLTLIAFSIIALVVGLRFNPLPISLIGVVITTIEVIILDPVLYGSSFGGLFIRDAFADFFIYIILIVAFLVLLSSTQFGGDKGAYNFLLMISFAGAIWVVMATDLIALFLAWELMSTPTYILVALGPDRLAIDGATKYFVMGLISTMFMIFGIALVYGVTGATTIAAVAAGVTTVWANPVTLATQAYTLLLAMVLFVIAFGFKVGIFPGWMWVPDTYASADGSVTAYLAGATKKTGISALVRILMVGFIVARFEWLGLIIAVSILTMVIGNFMALAQKDILRMLAYSSIAMMGYVFIGFAASTQYGIASAFFLAFVHALMKAGAFILIFALSIKLQKRITYDELAGMSKRSPIVAAMLGILVISLMGLPPTAGFTPKFMVFMSAVGADLWWLGLIGFINVVFSLGYYLRVLKVMYFAEPSDDSKITLPRIPMITVLICAVSMIVLFLFPGPVIDLANAAAVVLVP
ncbi:MAG: NADH-quinone oxidoreductase subunit N, partial [Candidatus Thorarchaeota archaeon]|nr:NADH-quinone oxidoreductase subunit N [Candidatus Thorarchaeota archaeon]